MANSLLKLTVESSEYDAKLKKAAEGIRHLADVAHQSDGDLTGLEKSTLDYIKSVGEMETKSRSAAGQVRELESTYKELKVIYDQLNDVEKADEGGKALAASLEQIKQRAQEARAQLDNASKSLNDNGQSAEQSVGILESLASKFTLNIDALKLFDMGLSATKAALDVAMDAFFASEANVDEWGRIVASSQSLYEGFLTAINNGDISGYLSNIDSIVEAARKAYDELDKLGTMKTIQAPQISKQQTENERIRQMIQTGRYIAPQDGRTNAVFNGRVMQNGDKLTAGQIRAMEKQLSNGMQSVTKLVGNEVKQTGKAIDAYYNKIAKTNGMTLQEFKKGTSSWDEFSKKMAGYDEYKKWDTQSRIEFAKQGGRGFVDFDKNNPYAEFRKWGTFRVDKDGENSYKDLVSLIQQRDQQVSQMYSTQTQAFRTMNRAEGFTVSKLMGKGGGSGSGTKNEPPALEGSIDAQTKKVQELQKAWRAAADDDSRQKIKAQLDEAQRTLKTMTGVKLPKDTVVDITVDANTAEALQKIGNIEGVTIDPKTFAITATDEAMPKLRDIEGVTIDPKTSVITATDEAMPKLRDIEGVTIEPKNMTVTADTTEALQRVQELIAQVNGTVVGIKVEPIKVEPGSLKAYQEQLKESQSDLQVMREDLLRLKEVGAEPMEIAVKEDEIQDAIDNISTIEKKIDELNGKSANISINIGDEAGSFDIGESMMEKLRDEIAASAENADMSTITEFIKQGIENGVDSADMTSIGQKLIQRMTNGDDIDPSDMEDFLATMKEKLQGIIDEEEWPKIEIAVKTGDLTAIQEFIKRVQVASKTAEDGWKHAASAISTLGSALNQIEDPMAKVVGTIAMAVAQVAEAAGKAINAKDTTSSGWAWIGAATAITATMVSTIATIHSATKFADGGIVPGSTMSGDQIPALLNAQEVVLNHAQVGNLAAQLEGGSSQGGQPNVRIEGEDLWITLNNYTQRSGYGEIVTSK